MNGKDDETATRDTFEEVTEPDTVNERKTLAREIAEEVLPCPVGWSEKEKKHRCFERQQAERVITRHLAAEEQARAERDAEVANTIDYIIREEGWQMCETHVDMLNAALALLSEAKEV